MKSRICYLECPLKEFIEDFPQLLYVSYQTYSQTVIDEFLKDDNYIVRYNGSVMEVGYPSDKWYIK